MQETAQTEERRRIPFKELSRQDKALRITALCLELAVFLCCFITAIFYAVGDDPYNRMGPAFRMAAVALLPLIVELIFGFRLSSALMTVVYLFMFFAGFLGATMNFWRLFSFYDDIMHGIFGYVGCYIGLYLFVKSKNYNTMNLFGIALALFSFSMACEAIWEVFEFINDTFLGGNAQGQLIEGILNGQAVAYRWVNDTMSDIIMNFIGATVFTVHFILHRLTKKDLLLGTAVKDFEKRL